MSNNLLNYFSTIKKNAQIPVKMDLPVGKNLQDHIYPGGVHFTVTKPVSISHANSFSMSNLAKYFTSGNGPLTSIGGVEGLGFIKTKYANYSKDEPDIEIHFIGGEFKLNLT